VLYLDIDGTVRHGKDELGRFVNSARDVKVFDEVPNIIQRYVEAGWRIAGVTNQGGLALGLVSARNVQEALAETNHQCGDLFDVVSVCRHHPMAKDANEAVCWCRKPRAGLVVEAASMMNRVRPMEFYPPHMGLMVGDRPEDKACAEAAALPFMDAKQWRGGGWKEFLT